MAIITGNTSSNTTITGTYVKVPVGTTASRPTAELGMMRYNTTTGYFETYTTAGWGAIATPPAITTVSPTTYNGEQGTAFTITGSFFDAGATVKFTTTQGTEYSAAAVSFVNSSTLTATTPQDFTVANEPLSIKVINSSGLAYTLSGCIDCGGSPTWNTASGSLGSMIEGTAANFSVSASDPDSGGTIASYSLVSGALPGGLSLNASTGAITGTASLITGDTTYTFTLRATDNAGNNSADRQFSILVYDFTKIVTVSPAIGGVSTFDLTAGAAITMAPGTEYTITNNRPYSFDMTVKLWGAGGGNSSATGGQGGYTSGILTMSSGVSIKALAGAAGSSYGGGGASAIYNISNANSPYAVAGGGGGNGNPGGGGNGGGSSGNAGGASGAGGGGGGGTQSAGGSAGVGDRLTGNAGTFRNGGNGAGDSTTFAGGSGWGVGGLGRFKNTDGYQGGGGGGYYGGGGGGASAGGGGGGGGSGYIGGYNSSGQTTVGYGSDSDRGSAGAPATDGKIVIRT